MVTAEGTDVGAVTQTIKESSVFFKDWFDLIVVIYHLNFDIYQEADFYYPPLPITSITPMAIGLGIAAITHQDATRLGSTFEPPKSSDVDLLEALDVISLEVLLTYFVASLLMALAIIGLRTRGLRNSRQKKKWRTLDIV